MNGLARFAAGLVAACVASVIAACGQTHVYQAVLRDEGAPRASSRPPELYLGEQRPAWRFYDVGLVQAVGFGDEATPEDMADALRVRGRDLGCDALVKVSVDVGASLAHGYGVCVRATRTANLQPAPPAPPAPAAPSAPPPKAEDATPPSPVPQ